jgi:hypothetical protein
MSSAERQELYDLIDTLPERELHTARRFLTFLQDEATDPHAHLDEDDEMDEEEQERLHAAIERGLEQVRKGQTRPVEEVLAKLRARR